MTNNPPPLPQPEKKKHGCFFYGCIISLALFVFFIAAVFFVGWFALHTARKVVTEYTQTTPVAIEKTELPADQVKQLQARVEAFGKAVNAHSNTPPLVLTGPEIEALIAENPNLKQYQNCFSITLDGDTVNGQLSVPLDLLTNSPFSTVYNTLAMKGRYFNGGATFTAAMTNGELSMDIKSLSAQGKPVPDNIVSKVRQQDFANAFNQKIKESSKPNPFAQFESIEVKDSTLIITPKSN